MTDTSYLYQYFLEKSHDDNKTKESICRPETAKKENVKEKKESKDHE